MTYCRHDSPSLCMIAFLAFFQLPACLWGQSKQWIVDLSPASAHLALPAGDFAAASRTWQLSVLYDSYSSRAPRGSRLLTSITEYEQVQLEPFFHNIIL